MAALSYDADVKGHDRSRCHSFFVFSEIRKGGWVRGVEDRKKARFNRVKILKSDHDDR